MTAAAAGGPGGAWHPVAASHDLVPRHVFHGGLLGRELAVWRADDGFVNVWENRCLHRGVRLTIGVNDGRELRCRYHGWCYASRSAGCTYIPAHPGDAPARALRLRSWPAVERYGLVWSGEAPAGAVPDLPELDGPGALALRGIAVNAPAGLVVERLRGYRFGPSARLDAADAEVEVSAPSRHAVRLAAGGTALLLVVQPVDARRSVVRGVVDAAGGERGAVLRHHNRRLSALRDAVERESPPPEPASEPAPEPAPEPEAPGAGAPGPAPPGPAPRGRSAPLRVSVAERREAGEGVCSLRLAPLEGVLPTAQPGAHIDIHLPGGLVRQYSLTNGPGETADYVIGVKLEPDSAGGSRWIHEAVRVGDTLAVSEPHNNFPLRRDAARTLLVAGGIGVTPLLSMARTLGHAGLDWRLDHLVRSERGAPFRDAVSGLGDRARIHPGLGAGEASALLDRLLADRGPRWHVYVCGPAPMLDAARSAARRHGWPDEEVHFEYFANPNEIDRGSSFEVELARSGGTLRVPAGRSILEVLRESGVDLPSSCEQGACGTCAVGLVAGEPDHQDVCLGDAERAAGGRIVTCVSRARSGRLVLDL